MGEYFAFTNDVRTAGVLETGEALHQTIERVFRAESGRVLAALISYLNDFDLAEDAFQEALVVALEKWPRDGPPQNPGAWITATARHKAIDRLRRRKSFDQKRPQLAQLSQPPTEPDELAMDSIPDERLKLILTTGTLRNIGDSYE